MMPSHWARFIIFLKKGRYERIFVGVNQFDQPAVEAYKAVVCVVGEK
jgi:glucose-6-phosphate isomerase